ncbi:hypothetical protein SHJG_8437 [Streptomyces hygroscopicus subsp. jinggangensis 5008]|nr:hypothetical protein SHJG_8437 [Streptomyces hygroscopicus subsp. jinggangensis 5008]AGF67860.1 hypothetical protein SHJGH_8198 [Streptomyces hygroscopicus subsp. jinggangensis TL01]
MPAARRVRPCRDVTTGLLPAVLVTAAPPGAGAVFRAVLSLSTSVVGGLARIVGQAVSACANLP